MLSIHCVGTYQGNELTCNSSARAQSSQLAEPLWTDPGLMNGTGGRALISLLEEKKKLQAGNDSLSLHPKS